MQPISQKICKYNVFSPKICKYVVFSPEIRKYGIFVAKICKNALIDSFEGFAVVIDNSASYAGLTYTYICIVKCTHTHTESVHVHCVHIHVLACYVALCYALCSVHMQLVAAGPQTQLQIIPLFPLLHISTIIPPVVSRAHQLQKCTSCG